MSALGEPWGVAIGPHAQAATVNPARLSHRQPALVNAATSYVPTERGLTPMNIFAVLGPFLAWLIAMAFLIAVSDPEPVFERGWYWLASLMVSYAFSILPMMFAAWIDRRLSGKWWRSIACFAAGFGLAYALYYGLMHEGGRQDQIQIFHRFWFYVGLVWGLPAAVCSWVVRKSEPAG